MDRVDALGCKHVVVGQLRAASHHPDSSQNKAMPCDFSVLRLILHVLEEKKVFFVFFMQAFYH